jgi:large subunit ribosomal protein L25
MLAISAKVRKNTGKNTKALRKQGLLPAAVYGPKLKTLPLEVDSKEFKKIYQEAGESSLVKLQLPELKKEYPVLIHEIQKDPLSDDFLHIDFYQAPLTAEVEAKVPLVFQGTSPAVKELGGTLIKNLSELEIKALPQNLPKEIKISIENLKTFEDKILVQDLKLAKGIKILKDPSEIIASVIMPEKVEEELEKPPEEKVEEVEVVEKGKKERERTEGETKKAKEK